MKKVQYNEYLVGTIYTDGLVPPVYTHMFQLFMG